MAKIKNIIRKMCRTVRNTLDRTFNPAHHCVNVIQEKLPEAVKEDGTIDIQMVVDILEKKNSELDDAITENHRILDRLREELNASYFPSDREERLVK
jgi:hypothetical protein